MVLLTVSNMTSDSLDPHHPPTSSSRSSDASGGRQKILAAYMFPFLGGDIHKCTRNC